MTRPVITTSLNPANYTAQISNCQTFVYWDGPSVPDSRPSPFGIWFACLFVFWLSQLFRFRHFRDRDTAKNSPEANDSVPDSRPGRARKTPMRAPGFFVILAYFALSCRASSERGHSGPTHANVEA